MEEKKPGYFLIREDGSIVLFDENMREETEVMAEITETGKNMREEEEELVAAGYDREEIVALLIDGYSKEEIVELKDDEWKCKKEKTH